ncbi:hypothetical protein C8C85_0992 [Flavobacterium sp. 103]|nr:hypothetical protein C8C85_0992 [Flavobacterium sp. 103]
MNAFFTVMKGEVEYVNPGSEIIQEDYKSGTINSKRF